MSGLKRRLPFRRLLKVLRPARRRLLLEPLEARQLLATVNGLQLSNDTGVSTSDQITYDGTVAGTVSVSSQEASFVTIEFDHDGDGTADGSQMVGGTGGAFTYDPVATDTALANWEGPFTLRHRTIEHQMGGTVTESWQEFSFTLDRVGPAAVSLTPSDSSTVGSSPSEVFVAFDEAVDASTLAGVEVRDNAGQPIPNQAVTLSGQQAVVALEELEHGEFSTTATGVHDLAGNPMAQSNSAAWSFLAPPTSNGIGSVLVYEDADDTLISLTEAFNDPQSEFTYNVSSNSNPDLFSSTTIDSSQTLILDYAPNAHGSADLSIEATDSNGLSTITSFSVTVISVNDPPEIVNFGSEPGPTTWNFSGQVLDDENVVGLLVQFGGILAGNSVVTEEEGLFYFSIPLSNSGMASAKTTDVSNVDSATVYEYVFIG